MQPLSGLEDFSERDTQGRNGPSRTCHGGAFQPWAAERRPRICETPLGFFKRGMRTAEYLKCSMNVGLNVKFWRISFRLERTLLISAEIVEWLRVVVRPGARRIR